MRFCCLLFLPVLCCLAQTPMPLWPDGKVPLAQGQEEIDRPTLTAYLPETSSAVGTGVVVCPGGGYLHLAMDHEGKQIAEFLNKQGIAAFVLKYRLGPKYHHPVELMDAQRAIRTVRANAAQYGIQPTRLGIWGFSAGGHLASTAGTHFDAGKPDSTDVIERQSSRPDFMILSYPVISLEPPFAHQGSRKALLGDSPDPALVKSLSNEQAVTPQTPPTFIFQTDADTVVPAENSVQFYLALRRNKVPAEMHIYLPGKHGVGLAPQDPVLHSWADRLVDWLKLNGWLTR